MAEEALRVPLQLKETRFLRTPSLEGFAKFLLLTEPGALRSDADFGCRAPHFTPELAGDLKTEVRSRVLEQFQRYMKVIVAVSLSEQVTSPTASYTCNVSGRLPSGEKFALSWEV